MASIPAAILTVILPNTPAIDNPDTAASPTIRQNCPCRDQPSKPVSLSGSVLEYVLTSKVTAAACRPECLVNTTTPVRLAVTRLAMPDLAMPDPALVYPAITDPPDPAMAAPLDPAMSVPQDPAMTDPPESALPDPDTVNPRDLAMAAPQIQPWCTQLWRPPGLQL